MTVKDKSGIKLTFEWNNIKDQKAGGCLSIGQAKPLKHYALSPTAGKMKGLVALVPYWLNL